MYFDEFIKTNKILKYKAEYLNRAFFQEMEIDFGKITSLSKVERENLEKFFTEHVEKHSVIKSIKPRVTGSGRVVSEQLQKHLEEKNKFSDEHQYLTKNLHFKLHRLLHEPTSNTYKAVIELMDGKKVETVLMKFEDGRNSVCVSCQVGCPVGCIFCASGQMGFMRNLTSHEIVDQVIFFARLVKSNSEKDSEKSHANPAKFERISNVVYMGMGEPMLNYDNVVASIRTLTNPEEFGLGSRHVTVSSSGYVKQLENYMLEGLKTRLAISLHAPNQKLREELMPVAKVYKLDSLMEFLTKWESYTKRRVSYEYTMISGVNDAVANAYELSDLLRGRLVHVNLIPMNPIAERDDLQRSSKNKLFNFARVLKENQVPVTIRITMGDRIQAACGQLVNLND